ncbi:DUF3253 domain-containing protein [Mucilaginibacter ginkgonis]|uniref:DUF3253 domain-containing protein n=1 Tax=Mucilaginibacter ginkgonis TaxID=2682091 RepID=A0A6I4I1J9_9SPHI|nr:DUF3253 domain-containing protein [Mucilaginibacter ginkgonis]QQL50485.1 DUF3253 domain-containing protein [Mucilaginibacter ginkgonis]
MRNQDQISNTIVSMATERGVDKTICPSDVVRALFYKDWRRYMPEVRAAAIELQHAGKVVITQKGEMIDTDHIKGPIRIRIVK